MTFGCQFDVDGSGNCGEPATTRNDGRFWCDRCWERYGKPRPKETPSLLVVRGYVDLNTFYGHYQVDLQIGFSPEIPEGYKPVIAQALRKLADQIEGKPSA